MSRLASILAHLPSYWVDKGSRDAANIQRLAETFAKLDRGQSWTPEDYAFVWSMPLYQRLLAPPARALDELDEACDDVRRSRDLDWAWGWILDLLAMNIGVRRPQEFYGQPFPDPWMRELVRLFVWCHTAHANADDLVYALAWFIAIARRDPDWKITILPQITLRGGTRTHYIARPEPMYIEFVLPWELVNLYADDAFIVSLDNDAWWYTDPQHGLDVGVLDGHHLLTDCIAFLRHIVPAGVRFEIYGTGFYVADTDSAGEGQGFWVEDAQHGLDVGRMPGLLEDGAIEPLSESEWEQLRIAPFSYAAIQKEIVHYDIRYKDGALDKTQLW